MSAENTDMQNALKDTKFTENYVKKQEHYRYGTLFGIMNFYKYTVCSFERFTNIKERIFSQEPYHFNVCQ